MVVARSFPLFSSKMLKEAILLWLTLVSVVCVQSACVLFLAKEQGLVPATT